MRPKPYDLVVFDLGGVLVRIAQSWEEAHRRADLAGEPLADADWDPRWVATEELLATGAIGHEEAHRRIAAASRGRYGPEDIRRVRAAWLIEEYPGVGAVVEAVHASGLETAVLSNTNELHWDRVLRAESEAGRFATVRSIGRHFASHQLRAVKPDAAAFDAVTRDTGYRGRRK